MSRFSDYQREVEALGLSKDEILRRYMAGADALWSAIDGLTMDDLGLARAPEKWTIRQYIHHIVADDRATSACIEAAVCQPDNRCSLEWYDFKSWAEVMERARCPVGPAIESLSAERRYVTALLSGLPDAWDRSVSFVLPGMSSWIELTVGGLVLDWSVCHMSWHVRHIQETRRVCGC